VETVDCWDSCSAATHCTHCAALVLQFRGRRVTATLPLPSQRGAYSCSAAELVKVRPADRRRPYILHPINYALKPRKTAPYFLPKRTSKRDGDYTGGCK
jgi:hypothetical protein